MDTNIWKNVIVKLEASGLTRRAIAERVNCSRSLIGALAASKRGTNLSWHVADGLRHLDILCDLGVALDLDAFYKLQTLSKTSAIYDWTKIRALLGLPHNQPAVELLSSAPDDTTGHATTAATTIPAPLQRDQLQVSQEFAPHVQPRKTT